MAELQEQGPWTKYSAPPPSSDTEDGPWKMYASSATTPSEPNLPGATPRLLAAAKTSANPKIAEMEKPTKFEEERPGEGISLKGAGEAAWEGIKGLGTGLVKQLDPTSGLSGAGLTAIGLNPRSGTVKERLSEVPIVGAAHEVASAYRDPTASALEVPIAGVGSLVGESAERAREHAARGEGGAILGEAAVPAVTAALSPVVEPAIRGTGRMAGAFRESVGGATHDPVTGEMTKGTEALSRGGGAAIGGATGATLGSTLGPGGTYAGAGIGATAGGIAGPALMEKLFPEPAPRVAARELFNKTKTLTEAHEGAIAENEARSKAARVEQDRLQKVAQKAADDAENARNQHAEDLMRRQREQDSLDRAEKKAARDAETARNRELTQKGEDLLRRQKEQDALDKAAKDASDEAQKSRDQHAEDLMRRQKEQDALDAKHAKALKELEDARQKELAANEKFIQQHAEALNKRGGVPTEEGGAGTTQVKPMTPVTGNPQDLITRTRKIVVPGEQPTAEQLKRAGDFTQVPLERLKLLAAWGDELAKNEINRRVRNEPDFTRAPRPTVPEEQPRVSNWKPLLTGQPEAPASFRAGVERPLEKPAAGQTPETVAPMEKPKLTKSQENEIRSEISKTKQKIEKWSNKMGNARSHKVVRDAVDNMGHHEQRLAELNEALEKGQPIKILRGATKAELSKTYSSLTPELKGQADALLQAYQNTEGFGREEFARHYGLGRGEWKGLPIAEKMARIVTKNPGGVQGEEGVGAPETE